MGLCSFHAVFICWLEVACGRLLILGGLFVLVLRLVVCWYVVGFGLLALVRWFLVLLDGLLVM